MASATTASLHPSALRPAKRSHSALLESSPPSSTLVPSSSPAPATAPKRRCRGVSLDQVLKSDGAGFARYAARAAALAALAVPDAVVGRLMAGLGGDPAALLQIVDLNSFAPGVTALLADYATRGVPLAGLGIRGHSFSCADKERVLVNFAGFWAKGEAGRWPRDVAAFAAREIFSADACVGITVLSGGGVRDVLLADWCAMYKLGPAHGVRVPPQLIIVSSADGTRSFLIPFIGEEPTRSRLTR
jgi:hypothetical protein